MGKARELVEMVDTRLDRLFDDWLKQIQFITWFIEDPCDAPFLVYMEALQEPLGEFLLLMFTPVPEEILMAFIQPMGREGCRGGRRGKRKGWKGALKGKGNPANWLPDPNEYIANGIKTSLGIETPFTGKGSAVVFKLINMVEAVTYNLFFYDALGDLAYGWLSAVSQSKYCQNSVRPRCRMFEATYSSFPFHGVEVMPMPGNKVAYGNCTISFADWWFRTDPYEVFVTFTVVNGFDYTKTFKYWITHTHRGKTETLDEVEIEIPMQSTRDVILRGRSKTPGVGRIMWENNGETMTAINFNVYAQGGREPVVDMDLYKRRQSFMRKADS